MKLIERFEQFGERLRAEGAIFPCDKCGKERDSHGCLDCGEDEDETDSD